MLKRVIDITELLHYIFNLHVDACVSVVVVGFIDVVATTAADWTLAALATTGAFCGGTGVAHGRGMPVPPLSATDLTTDPLTKFFFVLPHQVDHCLWH